MSKISTLFYLFIASATLAACGGKKAETDKTLEEGVTQVTPAQFKSSGMVIGKPSEHTFQDLVECKGYVVAPANAMAEICPPIAGKVNAINFKVGDYVHAGQVVATIAGNDFMELQQQFAQAAATFGKAKLDYERAKSLWDEKIGAHKDFLAAKSAYQTAYAGYQSLRSRISALHLNAAKVENGNMYTAFPLTAPISGYITEISAVIGQFTDMENNIAKIVNTAALQLKLNVYESDVRKLAVGQAVTFGTGTGAEHNLHAKLTSIGKTVNPETKTIDCIAAIDRSTAMPLVNDSYAEAAIVIGSRHALALPESAVQKQGNDYSIFVINGKRGQDYLLKKTPIAVGAIQDGYVELKSASESKQVVLKGVDTMP